MRTVIALCLTLFAAGCIKRTEPTRLPERAKITVVYVVDGDVGVVDAPEPVKKEVESALNERNLEAVRVPFDSVSASFNAVRDSSHRFNYAMGLVKGSQLLLLVELRTEFFSQLQGQYRWQVYGKLSTARVEAAQPITEAFDVPAFMLFDHERTPEVLITKAPAIAEHASALVDNLIRETTPAPTPKPVLDHERPQVNPKGAPETPPQQGALNRDAIYFVMVDRFANGDRSNDGEIDLEDPQAFHGGDLQGVIDHLDYLQNLGVKTVWLSPVFKMRTEKFFGYGAFHGYWTYDLTRVEPRFGTEETLKKLSNELHRRGMKLVLDLVLNHVGPDHPWVKERPTWFHNQGALQNWDDEKELVTKDVHGLPDLAQEKDDVYRYLLGSSLAWIDRVHPDGFRLDAVKHMPLAFWARFNTDVKRHAGPDFMLLGEMLEGDAQKLAEVKSKGGFTHIFDFPLHFAMVDTFCKGQSPVRLAATLSQDRLYADPSTLVTLVDNHDLPRIQSVCGEKADEAIAFEITTRGTPSFIWGTEVGLAGGKEPANRGDMKFEETPRAAKLKSYLDLRASLPALRDGVPYLVSVDKCSLAYARLARHDAALIVLNQCAPSKKVELSDALFEVAVSAPVTNVTFQKNELAVSRLVLREGYESFYERAQQQWATGAIKRDVKISAEVPAEQGDAVFLVGSGEELGAWNPAKGLGPLQSGALSTTLPEGFAYEYKLVIKKRDGRTEWEPGENRALFVSRGKAPLQVALKWAEQNG